jgi:hypothetical protein
VGTGLIFAAVVIAWAVFLVPWALRRYDEATRARSVDRFSRGMRLLRRSKAGGRWGGAAAAAGDADVDPDAKPVAARPLRKSQVSTAPVEPPRLPSRAAARAAARRRRRVLWILLGITAVIAALAAFAVLPRWAAAIPAGLVVAFLGLCRWQVRREDDAAWVRRRAGQGESASAAAVDGADDEPTVDFRKASAEARDGADGRQAVEADAAPVADADLAESTSVAVTVSTEDGRSLWDPLPVTLPTYVSKAKATRTVRTIDLGEPDTWTSGRVEGEQTEMPSSDDASSTGSDDSDSDAHRRAVGD